MCHSKTSSSHALPGPFTLSELTSDDIDFFFKDSPMSIEDVNQNGNSIKQNIMIPAKGVISDLNWFILSQLVRPQQKRMATLCYHCWVAVDGIFEEFDRKLEPLWQQPFSHRSVLSNSELQQRGVRKRMWRTNSAQLYPFSSLGNYITNVTTKS